MLPSLRTVSGVPEGTGMAMPSAPCPVQAVGLWLCPAAPRKGSPHLVFSREPRHGGGAAVPLHGQVVTVGIAVLRHLTHLHQLQGTGGGSVRGN